MGKHSTMGKQLLFIAVVGLMGFLCLSAPRVVHAQATCNAAPFLAVSSWTGTVSITGTGSGTIIDTDNGDTITYSVHQSIQLGPVMTVSPTDPRRYSGPENATININDQYTDTPAANPGNPNPITNTYDVAVNGTSVSGFFGIGAGLSFASLPGACGYAFGADDNFSPFTITVNGSSSQSLGVWGTSNIPNFLVPPFTPAFVPFPTSGTTLSGSITFTAAPTVIPVNFTPLPPINWTVTWNFIPTPTPLDLLVSIPAYSTWRPSAGRSETDLNVGPNSPANLLDITAQLVYKDTQLPTPFGPNKITFSLVGVSHEPGVALNWPSHGMLITPTPPDLSFSDLSGKNNINPDYTLNADGTVAVEMPPASDFSPVFDVLLAPYDWGGWATLNVTAEVAGQPAPIQGHLVQPLPSGGAIVTDILLPQRQPGSFIADQWKSAHGAVGLSDNDDSDSKPKGDNQPGDGFSLYEEYRGFYMGCAGNKEPIRPEGMGSCVHVEGDPVKKDLFIVDKIDYPSDVAIMVFAQQSGLRVHFRGLKSSEIRPDRVINFNHSAGPHNVDQHALIVDTVPPRGYAQAVGGPGLPAFISVIEIPLPGGPNSGFQPFENTTETINGKEVITFDVAKEYLSTVAHELSHAVNVYHHGETDRGGVVWSVEDNLVFETTSFDQTQIQVMLQGSAQPLTPAEVGPLLTKTCTSGSTQVPCAHMYVGNNTQLGTVIQGGQHSGDVFCWMRYDSAGAYIPLGSPSVRIFVTEFPGPSFTDITAGTGVNTEPNSRYGNAASNRGNCSDQVDVNDGNTLIVR